MASIGQILYNIKSLRNQGEHTKDLKLGNRQLEFITDSLRAKIATYNAMSKLSLEGFIQSLDKVKLVPTEDFRYIDDSIKIFEAKGLPSLISADGVGLLFDYVGLRNTHVAFQKSTPSTFVLDLSRKYISSVYFSSGDSLYVASKDRVGPTTLLVRGVFASPRTVLEFNGAADAAGFDWKYPIPQNFVNQLNTEIINSEYRWMHMLPPDLSNDGRDNTQQ